MEHSTALNKVYNLDAFYTFIKCFTYTRCVRQICSMARSAFQGNCIGYAGTLFFYLPVKLKENI